MGAGLGVVQVRMFTLWADSFLAFLWDGWPILGLGLFPCVNNDTGDMNAASSVVRHSSLVRHSSCNVRAKIFAKPVTSLCLDLIVPFMFCPCCVSFMRTAGGNIFSSSVSSGIPVLSKCGDVTVSSD